MKTIVLIVALSINFVSSNFAQARADSIKTEDLVKIVSAEDALRFDAVLKQFFNSKNSAIQARAALAAGRIGDVAAIEFLLPLLENKSTKVAETAVFALGEIESDKAADAIIAILADKASPLRARAIEAAGKIAAANQGSEFAKPLGNAIKSALQTETLKPTVADYNLILFGVTAALRAKPDGVLELITPFLKHSDPRVKADTLNALARLRAKGVAEDARKLLTDSDAEVRANAARLLGFSDDKTDSLRILELALNDKDLRVRISAIRALASSEPTDIAEKLVTRANTLFSEMKTSGDANDSRKNEVLTIFTTLGTMLKGSNSSSAIELLNTFRKFDRFSSPESEVALAQIMPNEYLTKNFNQMPEGFPRTVNALNAVFQGALSIKELGKNAQVYLDIRAMLHPETPEEFSEDEWVRVLPALLEVFSKFDSENYSDEFDGVLAEYLNHKDVFVRAAVAGLIASREYSPERAAEFAKKLESSFAKALNEDKRYDDAQLALLDAIVKIEKEASLPSLNLALNHYSILVRTHAAFLIKENGWEGSFPNLKSRVGTVTKYDSQNGSKLGQVTESERDYRRAVTRKNGSVKAVVTTQKGDFTIEFYPEDAPLTVDNFISLAKSGYFNGLDIHRVVPNFVVQDGDPRGDGNGGPGWQIRCEINMLPYKRGTVGMALSGKDTGGSQWFVTHAPQPHLDGGYTVFGFMNERDMKIVDKLVRGDKIRSVEIKNK
ncbi:MAG: peptidylprolyl isomerase [Pyrinomonadaceae bacterium]